MYLTDYHTHTKLSPDGSVPLADMADAAVAAGLNELCVTDHCDLLELYGEPWTTMTGPLPWSSTPRPLPATPGS